MRFVIRVDKDWQVTVTPVGGNQPLVPPRPLRRIPYEGHDFPAPQQDLPADTEPHYALCAAAKPELLAEAHKQITGRSPNLDDVVPFGRYLFDTLIGKTAWDAILACAAAVPGTSLLDLALAWSPLDSNLNALNWELMHTGKQFLAAGVGPLAAAITRLVPREFLQDPNLTARQIQSPPRVLFVVGTALSDPVVRPGAEILGLLRQLERGGRRLHWRVLEMAKPSTLARSVQLFHPEIVHFICHGDIDPTDRRGYLELQPEQTGGESRRKADELVSAMSLEGIPPPLVVLSACYTATVEALPTLRADKTAPLAAELVTKGVPVVIGMGGRVSDMACRLFTRRFGEALVRGESLVAATEVARRATFAEGANPRKTVDWAFPAVFMAESVTEDYAPVAVKSNDLENHIDAWIGSCGLEEAPVFCGREDFFRAYYDLFDPIEKDLQTGQLRKPSSDRKRVLLAYADLVPKVSSGFGRSRLLKELAKQALHDGHVPILISPVEGAHPQNAAEFCAMLRNAIDVVREEHLHIPRSRPSQLAVLDKPLSEARIDPTLDDDIRRELDKGLTTRAVRLAVQKDLSALALDARAPGTYWEQMHGNVLVLLDDIDRYGGFVQTLLEENALLGRYGLGTSDEPVPVIMTCLKSRLLVFASTELLEKPKLRPWLITMPLQPFAPDNDADLMAYELVLLNPFDDKLYDGFSNRAWTLNDAVPDSVRKYWVGIFRKRLFGVPDLISSVILYHLVEDSKREEFVVEADDAKFLRKTAPELADE